MLELKNITKKYKIGDVETVALDDISVSFRKEEFVAILGTSGSGKTTCLNIIGGLDRYDSGDLIIKGKHTTDFKERDWDAYRNNSIGFVFQSYNLISHLSIVANVEMGMTLSGVSAAKKHEKALECLEKVGLKEHLHKKPNQLSGGQMQRVAIARALANDPEILLCDEPTGALDSKTSVQIMDLIKEIAKDKLVIMVTHNPDLAHDYANRIVEFRDGRIISDSNPYQNDDAQEAFVLNKTSMSFITALRLSFNNIKTKLGRTFLTSFASSIGIIGIAVILSLSVGFQVQIDNYQEDALAEFPIIISKQAVSMDPETIQKHMNEMSSTQYSEENQVFAYDSSANSIMHENRFSQDYLEYIKNIDPTICDSIGYTRIVGMNLVRDIDGTKKMVSISGNSSNQGSSGLSTFPVASDGNINTFLEKNYDVLAGNLPEDKFDMVLVVNEKNQVELSTLTSLGFEAVDKEGIDFDKIVGTEMKLVNNDDFYTTTPFQSYMPSNDYQMMYDSKESQTVKISAVIRAKEDANVAILNPGIAYSDSLSQYVIDQAEGSKIVEAQKAVDYNILTLEAMDEAAKEQMMAYLGGDATPYLITLYPTDFENKDKIVEYLDTYNDGLENRDDIVVYTDLAATISSLTGGIMGGITMVLVAFAGTSLIVSLIMICIITYTSVLERTKEIGILKALGARKKDITRVFDAETCILGVFSGTLGIIIAYLLTFPINAVIYSVTELSNVASLKREHAVILILISTILTMAGGHIPARMASKKDAVEALRTE
ncbi:MAG: ATP-binding cassette domain-containing protein [Beduini sp.]|uniref:ABC transporter ATP-binding protein/permease n=1 Tax=Beduini sp. TaxID=1922300 RepID=UPI0039A1A897